MAPILRSIMLLALIANTWASVMSSATSAYKYYSDYSKAKAWQQAYATNGAKGDQVAYDQSSAAVTAAIGAAKASAIASGAGAGIASYAGLASCVSSLGLGSAVTTATSMAGITAASGAPLVGAAATAALTTAIGGPAVAGAVLAGGVGAGAYGAYKITYATGAWLADALTGKSASGKRVPKIASGRKDWAGSGAACWSGIDCRKPGTRNRCPQTCRLKGW